MGLGYLCIREQFLGPPMPQPGLQHSPGSKENSPGGSEGSIYPSWCLPGNPTSLRPDHAYWHLADLQALGESLSWSPLDPFVQREWHSPGLGPHLDSTSLSLTFREQSLQAPCASPLLS
jgi:hypothetical protein